MNHIYEESIKKRIPEHDINPVFIGRWSQRGMSGEEITDKELMRLFEAAKWAPSSFNDQPWRFIYAKKGTKHWGNLFNLLVDANKVWAKNASILILVVSHKNFEYNNSPNRTSSFSAGSAFENLSLQAAELGLVSHAMAGFDYEKARKSLGVPDDYSVEAIVAIGKYASKDSLPEELKKMEEPSLRKPLKELIMEGKFKN